MRSVGQRAADLAEVAGSGEAAGDDHEHLLGQALDLSRMWEEKTTCLGRERRNSSVSVEPLAGIGAVEGLVEQEHAGSWTSAAATLMRCFIPFE